MSVGFLGVFMAFNTTQMVLSTALQHFHGSVSHMTYDLGSASLMTMYLSTMPSLWFIPRIIRRRGPVPVMIIGGLCYVFYITSLIWPWEPAVYLTSCLVGFGQAAIWVSQGVVLSSNSDEEQRGSDAGLFWGIYSASGITGPLIGFFVYQGASDTGFFLFSTMCASVGTAVFLRLLPTKTGGGAYYSSAVPVQQETFLHDDEFLTERKPLVSPPKKKNTFSDDEEQDNTVLFSIIETYFPSGWTCDRVVILFKLLPFMFFVGISDAFINASFPLMFAQRNDQEAAVFLVFLGWGIMETFGALAFSRFSDTMGRNFLLCISAVIYLIGYTACILILFADGISDSLPSEIALVLRFDVYRVSWLAFIAGACFGLADTLNNTQAFAILGDHFPEARFSVDVYAIYQFLQALGMAIGFALSLLTPVSWLNSSILIGVQLISLTASLLGILACPSSMKIRTLSS